MKRKPVPLFKIGMFVLAGFILLVVIIFMLGSKQKMFSSTTEVKARFTTVSSLKKGAQVQMAGINVGSVKEILLPKSSRDMVTITMKIETDALKLIHTDSRAIITTEGLIGEKIVVITIGGDSTLAVAPGSMLQGEPSKDFGRIMDTLNAAVAQVNELTGEAAMLVHDLRQGNGTVSRLLNDDALYRNTNEMIVAARGTMTTAREAVDRAAQDFNSFSLQVNDITARINRGEGSLGKLLTRDDLYNDLQKTSSNLSLSSYDLRDALAKITLGSGRFAEVMEAFKHNFLVKGYFEDRGYWDASATEMTIDRKIDSLSRLQRAIDLRLPAKKVANE